jgi:predicted tellurium resistance membrane protein TerC
VKTYSDTSGLDISDFLLIVEGVAALFALGSLAANFQSPQRPALFASIFFAVFLFLFAAKLILNLLDFYPSEIYLPTVISGITASILLWLEQ